MIRFHALLVCHLPRFFFPVNLLDDVCGLALSLFLVLGNAIACLIALQAWGVVLTDNHLQVAAVMGQPERHHVRRGPVRLAPATAGAKTQPAGRSTNGEPRAMFTMCF